MATASFTRHFAVNSEKVNKFVEEMTKKATPTLTKNFSSRLQYEKDLKYNLHKAILPTLL